MRTLAVIVVTLGFFLLINVTFAQRWSPLVPGAYAVFFIGWEIYAHATRDEARYRRFQREAKGLCLQCGYDLAGNVSNVCPECGDGRRPDPSMDRSMIPFRETLAAGEALSARLNRFRGRPFPTEWAKVVNGVGLASLTMRAERALGDIARLHSMCEFRLSYLHSIGEPRSTAAALFDALHPMPAEFDRFLAALPPDARAYFADLRALVADGLALAEQWWSIDAAARPSDVTPDVQRRNAP